MAASDADSERPTAAAVQSEIISFFPSQCCSPRADGASSAEGLGTALAELKLESNDTDLKVGNVGVEGGANAGWEGSASEEDGKEREERKTGGEKARRGRDLYPQRPGVPDCAFYVRTGKCAFGKNCKFNHPFERRKVQSPDSRESNQNVEESVKGNEEEESEEEELPVKVGKLKCKYYGTPGGCKYGDACRYSHFQDRSEAEAVELNFLGLPVRPAVKECQFYMRTGSCKFSASCRYHHPDPTAAGGSDSPSGFSSSSFSHSPNLVPASWHHQIAKDGSFPIADSALSYIHQMPTTQLQTNRVWNFYQAPTDPYLDLKGKQKHLQYPLSHDATTINGGETQPSATPSPTALNESSDASNSRQLVQVADLPQRPGQPECPYYLKKGGCKYKSCKFHHPKDHLQNPSACVLNPNGLPLRPGQSICTHYSRYGICKFGPACSFDHPTSHIPS